MTISIEKHEQNGRNFYDFQWINDIEDYKKIVYILTEKYHMTITKKFERIWIYGFEFFHEGKCFELAIDDDVDCWIAEINEQEPPELGEWLEILANTVATELNTLDHSIQDVWWKNLTDQF